MNDNISQIYSDPLKSSRSGSLFMAFSYPTKISPETIALYILAHTNPGDTVLDVFGGSGTTGLATLLCDTPNKKLIELVKQSKFKIEFGPRSAHIGELSGIGAFISEVMTSKINSDRFSSEAINLLNRVRSRIGNLYSTTDPEGKEGEIRHVVHSEFLICENCNNEVPFSESCVYESPLKIESDWVCAECNFLNNSNNSKRVIEEIYDPVLDKKRKVRKRRPYKVYGQTSKYKWKRYAKDEDYLDQDWKDCKNTTEVPIHKINWGDLYRSGYHYGIEFMHDFYTQRNLEVMSILWQEIKNSNKEYQKALKLWILSYNSSHSTLMTRVVLKKNQTDFVITGAQPGVLYISSLPVEKNILLGLERKIKTFKNAFAEVENSQSTVDTAWGSSSELNLTNDSINYVFTDPPFGDYIPYSELNLINEVWLDRFTNNKEEAIMSKAQRKNADTYEDLLTQVFSEVNRVLKDSGSVSVVFHSASSKVWNALKQTFKNSGFKVIINSVLEKDQASFKQTNSKTSVKGDAVMLLKKGNSKKKNHVSNEEIISKLLSDAKMKNIAAELERERLYSRYVGFCMASHIQVELGAREFYAKLNSLVLDE